MSWKLGSLFDGSGGFPLAASLCGVEPVWASEVEPYPIAVTRSRFPNMKHLGDISKINGAEIEPVDIITFGSPCQDLSVAGKRAGLKHEANGDEETTRSGLFMEAVRIIREMREATNGEYPRFALWENVPGAFSSNKGEDFRIVLEELIKIVEPRAVMPEVPKRGWAYADSFVGNGWSISYRIFDAQYWGVPQRRRRIHLVADLRGECAREVLFEREGVRGYFAQGGTPWENLAAYAESGAGADHREGADGSALTAYSFDSLASNSMKSSNPHSGCRQVEVAKTIDTTDPNPSKNQGGIAIVCKTYDACGNGDGDVPMVMEPIICMATQQGGAEIRTDDKAPTVTAAAGMSGNNQPVVCYEPAVFDGAGITCPTNASNPQPGDPCHTLSTDSRNYLVYCLQGNGIDRADTAGCNGKGWKEGVCYTLNTIDRPAIVYWDGGQTAGTLTANNAGGNQRMPDKDNFNCVIALDRAFYNQGQNALYEPQFYEDGTVPTLVARGPGAVCHSDATGVDCWNATESVETTGALQASSAQNINSNNVVRVRYIVRRLTPTECARLQGFADCWGEIEEKKKFTDEEYRFWLDVRNAHAAINGKAVKDYTKAQMLTWYNKLHTDSAEYKMWGNGIALPPALYCMQGMTDVLKRIGGNENGMDF